MTDKIKQKKSISTKYRLMCFCLARVNKSPATWQNVLDFTRHLRAVSIGGSNGVTPYLLRDRK